MTDDDNSWRRFAEHGDEDAFRAVVRGHLDLVYSTAIRVVGEHGLAEDVAQEVFTDFARKAAELDSDTLLAGWFYRAARFAAAKALRGEIRRRQRETLAQEIQMNDPEPTPDWAIIRPLLDAAMDELPSADRDAVVLRFFQRQDLRTVGQRLGIGDDAARKRVDRALDRLRSVLGRRGVTTSASALGCALSAHALAAAPPGLALHVSTTALAAAATAAMATTATSGTAVALTPLLMAKTQTVLITAALVSAGVATPLIFQHRRAVSGLDAENQRLVGLVADLQAAANQRAPGPTGKQPTDSAPGSDNASLELLRLRGEVAQLRAKTRELEHSGRFGSRPKGAGSIHFRPTANSAFVALAQLENAGIGTPEDALKSYYHALANPDTGSLAQVLDMPKMNGFKLPRLPNGQSLPVNFELNGGKTTLRIGDVVPTSSDPVNGSSSTTVAVSDPNSEEGEAVATVQLNATPPAPGAPRGDSVFQQKVEVLGEDGQPASTEGITGYRIVGEAQDSPEEKTLQVEQQRADGTTSLSSVQMVKTDDGWKVRPSGAVKVEMHQVTTPTSTAPAPAP